MHGFHNWVGPSDLIIDLFGFGFNEEFKAYQVVSLDLIMSFWNIIGINCGETLLDRLWGVFWSWWKEGEKIGFREFRGWSANEDWQFEKESNQCFKQVQAFS